MLSKNQIQEKLTEKKLKITPQRMAVYDALYKTGGHPTADEIYNYVSKQHPGISRGTVYRTLDTLVENGLVNKVSTKNDIMIYDPITDAHHHLYCSDSNTITDYIDEELDNLLKNYFKKKKIKDFYIENIKVYIEGNFK